MKDTSYLEIYKKHCFRWRFLEGITTCFVWVSFAIAPKSIENILLHVSYFLLTLASLNFHLNPNETTRKIDMIGIDTLCSCKLSFMFPKCSIVPYSWMLIQYFVSCENIEMVTHLKLIIACMMASCHCKEPMIFYSLVGMVTFYKLGIWIFNKNVQLGSLFHSIFHLFLASQNYFTGACIHQDLSPSHYVSMSFFLLFQIFQMVNTFHKTV